jgi:hypothetical protein
MAEFSSGQDTTAQRLAAIEQQVREWDWRREQQERSNATDDPDAPRHKGVRMPATGRRLWVVVAGAAVVAAAAVGVVLGTGGSTPPAPAPGHSVQAQQFAAADKSVTEGGLVVAAGFNGLKGVPTVAAVSNVIDPYVVALARFQRQVGAIHWAAAERAGSKAVLSQASQFSTFLRTLQGLNPVGLGTWIHQFYAQVVNLTEANSVLRHQLGLPAQPVT